MPGFILRLVLDDKKIKFDPTIEEFEDSMMGLFERMAQVIQSIPRIETRLYAEWVSVCSKRCIGNKTRLCWYGILIFSKVQVGTG